MCSWCPRKRGGRQAQMCFKKKMAEILPKSLKNTMPQLQESKQTTKKTIPRKPQLWQYSQTVNNKT